MASVLAALTPLPAPQVPLVDPRTGLMARAWYEYFKRLDAHLREIEERLTTGGL